ncbi:MAG: Rab family GTPase [Candidatus Thorarchaeota archaeon]
MQEKEVIYTFKIVIVGAGGVGKTCLFNRFCFNSFNFDTSQTIGLSFHSMDLKVNNVYQEPYSSNKFIVNSIFDFGGQDRFKPLIPKFLGGANGAILTFDLTNEDSLEMLNYWFDLLMNHTNGAEIPKVLVGSKSDLLSEIPESKQIKKSNINKFLKDKELDAYYWTSALKNYNVIAVFKELNNLMLKRKKIPFSVL